MKRNLLFLTACVMIISVAVSAQNPADKIVGVYLTAKKTSQVRIFKATDGKYYGKVAWLEKDKDKKDVNNPDPAKRNEPILGLVILRGLKYDADKKQWSGGTIYDPDNGKTYDCYLWFDEKDPGILQLKGYVLGMRWLGRESSWVREEKLRE
ncbi:MAG: DUF2147 domain-containing protein [Bacteroidales bacterium]